MTEMRFKILFGLVLALLFSFITVNADSVLQQFPNEDTWTQEELPTTNYGTDTNLHTLGEAGARRNIMLKFNITNIGSNVQDANLSLYLHTFQSVQSVRAYYGSNQTWLDTQIIYDNQNTLGKNDGITSTSATSITAIGWYSWNITPILQHAKSQGDSNFTIILNTTDGTAGTYDTYYSSDNAVSKPYINVTHTAIAVVNTTTIYYPANTTYFHNNNTNITFSHLSSLYSTLSINATLDGVVIYHNPTYTNNTNVSFLYNVTGLGLHNLTVVTNQTQTSRFFTIKDYQIADINYTNPSYETGTYQYYILYRYNNDSISNISASFWYDGSFNGSYTTHSRNATHINITKIFTVPLELTTNNSARTHIWNATINYLNSTNLAINTSASQNIIFAYFLGANAQTQSSNSMSETDNFTNSLTITTFQSVGYLTANSTYRNVNYTMLNSTYTLFSVIINSGLVSGSGDNETYGVNSTAWVSFNGRSRTLTSETDNITIYKIIITDCSVGSASTTKAMTFFLKNEENLTEINGTIELALNVSTTSTNTRNYSFTFTNVKNASICLSPVNATMQLDLISKYYASGYSTRYYYIDANITNTTTLVDLFLLENAYSSTVVFFLRDQNNNPYTNAIIQIQKLYVGNNTFKTVAQCKSDDPDGKCSSYLRVFDTLYKYTVIKDGVIIKETTPSSVVCQPFETFTNCGTQGYPILITVSTITPNLYFNIFNNVQYSCLYNSTSTVLRCTVVDSTGLMSRSRLIVDRQGSLTNTTICDNSEYSSTLTLTCTLGNITGYNFFYRLLNYYNGNNTVARLIDQGTVTGQTALFNWGQTGFLLALMVIVALSLMGMATPIGSMAFAVLGIIAGFWIGLIPVGVASIIGLVIAIGILAYKSGS